MSSRSSSSGKRLVGGTKVVIDDGAHVVVDELCHMPELSPPPKRSPRNNGDVKVNANGVASRRKDGDDGIMGKEGSSSSSSSPKKKSRNVALVEFVAEPVVEADSVASSSSSPHPSSRTNLAEMKNELLEDLDLSVEDVQKERAENLTELFFLQVRVRSLF